MTLWLMLTITIAIAAVLVSALFMRRLDGLTVAAAKRDLAACFDQLIELEQKAATGTLKADEAETARAELRKRILSADSAEKQDAVRLSLSRRNLAVVSAAAVAIIGAVGLYAWNDGSVAPAAFTQSPSEQRASVVDQLAAAAAAMPPGPIASGQQPTKLGTVDEMIDRLAQRLQQRPNDAEGWRMLGWSYFNTDRYAESAAAYAKAVALSPSNADFKSAYGEALVRAAGGRVTNDAKTVFEQALQIKPADPRARFFIGLGREQAGDRKAALDAWLPILNDSPSNELWFADMQKRAAELGQELGIDVKSQLHPKDAEAKGGVLSLLENQPVVTPNSAGKDSLSADDIHRAETMPRADREAMIRGMVDGLAARLEQSPNDVEGWIKLIRSRKVLGETDAAQQALHRAMDIFNADPEQRDKIVAAGREAGLMQ